jgi:hypothetical protein
MQERHREIARIALSVGGQYGLALAGGYAVEAHGMGTRPSGDVDLFLDWGRRGDFDAMVSAVTGALETAGMKVGVVARAETFARLLVAPQAGADEPEKVELAADWRSRDPVMLGIGPVLHADDAVANKMTALYGRALARDFLDVDAILASGRYDRERLLELAASADAGFDLEMFAEALGALPQITDAAFAEYGIRPEQVGALRRRFAAWRSQLLAR